MEKLLQNLKKMEMIFIYGIKKDPYFYYLKTELKYKNGNILDTITQHVGFKYDVFINDEGFFLNGRHLKINGVCNHHAMGL